MESNTSLHLLAPWPEVKEKIKEAEIELSDSDLHYVPGKENELLDRLARKMKRTPDEIRFWIESISTNKGKAS